MAKLKIKVDKKIYLVEAGMTLYEFSRVLRNDFTYPILAANVDNVLTDLSKPLTNDATVKFYDRSSAIGNRIYARSLEFLVTVAAKKVLNKESDVLINYSLSNGIYCEVVGERINEKTIKSIENVMHEMVKGKLKFKKSIVSRLDAIKYFESHNQIDKVNSLRYTTNKTITLHILDGVYDYFFGPLVHDTSQINLFELLYLKENSFIINFPNKRKPKSVNEYDHHPILFAAYKEFQKWGRNVHLETTNDLNKLCTERKTIDAIRLSETYYEHQVYNTAEIIQKRKKDIKIVLISGPSSSGKTTSSKKLEMYLKVLGMKPHIISLDNYYVDRVKTPKDENGNYDFSNIKALQLDLLDKNISDLLSGKEVQLPKFNFKKGIQEYDGEVLKLEQNDILILEGVHAFNDILLPSIEREKKFKILVSPLTMLKIDNHNRVHTSDVRKLRRIVRDSEFRGFSALETLKNWPNVEKEAHEKIYPFEDDADMYINTALNYEIGVLRIYAEPLLYAIKEDSEYYPEVTRLINLLRKFLPISSEEVPKDSLLREFIGGGTYEGE